MDARTALRSLTEQPDKLTAQEKTLTEYLTALPGDLWDDDCETVAVIITEKHRRELPGLDPALPLDVLTATAAAERVNDNLKRWQRRRSFAEQSLVTVENEGVTQVIMVSLAHFNAHLVRELTAIPGRDYRKTFKNHEKVTLFPISSAGEVIAFAERHGLAIDPSLDTYRTQPVAVIARDPDITLIANGQQLRVTFPYERRAVAEIKEIPGRVYDRITKSAWFVPIARLADVHRFAQRHNLTFAPGLQERAEQAVAAEDWNYQQSSASAPDGAEGTVELASVAQLEAPAKAAAQFLVHNHSVVLAGTPGVDYRAVFTAAVDLRPGFGRPRLAVVCGDDSVPGWVKHLKLAGREDAWENDVILTFDALEQHHDLIEGLEGWATDLVVDETRDRLARHRLPALARVGRLVRDRHGLVAVWTHTPALTRPKELLALLEITGRVEELGGEQTFLDRFCGRRDTDFGVRYVGSSNLRQLDDLLRRAGAYFRQGEETLLS